MFYITTPIYYVNDVPHIGHAYTTIAADVLARYKRLCGERVFFLTGTDEHGQKVERTAKEEGLTPQALADRVVCQFQDLWQKLHIAHDAFIRTTDPQHRQVVQSLFRRIHEAGDIYLGEYEDWYCTPCETFWTETQLLQGNCPDCGRPTERLKEESYFFRMSKYTGPLLSYLEANPGFVQPSHKRQEILNFVRGGLKDLSISRTSFRWGVPVPDDDRHVIYVWFDALANYLTAAGYGEPGTRFRELWPADLHIMGKDILRFHAVYWPTFLMAAGLPLPRRVFGHGWWTVNGQKMSKSLRNAVDPGRLADEFGPDPLRYYLLREVPLGQDGDFSREGLVQRFNTDLANDLGNLLSRALTMVQRYAGGCVPAPSESTAAELRLQARAQEVASDLEGLMDELALQKALVRIWEWIGDLNRYLDACAPWTIAKVAGQASRLATILYQVVEGLRHVAVLLFPFLPETGQRIWEQLGCKGEVQHQRLGDLKTWGGLTPGTHTAMAGQLFPRREG